MPVETQMSRRHLRVFLSDKFCGCGCPEDASAFLLALLRAHPVYDHQDEWKHLLPDDGARYFVAYTIHNWALTEHGGNVMGSWLTHLGEVVRDALAAEEADGFEVLSDNCCVHGYSTDVDSHELDTHDCLNSDEPDTAAAIAQLYV